MSHLRNKPRAQRKFIANAAKKAKGKKLYKLYLASERAIGYKSHSRKRKRRYR